MGWGSGSTLLADIVQIIDRYVDGDDEWKVDMCGDLINRFTMDDCDTIDDARGFSESLDKAIDIWASQFED